MCRGAGGGGGGGEDDLNRSNLLEPLADRLGVFAVEVNLVKTVPPYCTDLGREVQPLDMLGGKKRVRGIEVI